MKSDEELSASRKSLNMSPLSDRAFLLSRRWPHHASHSGYDRLGHFVGTPLAATKPVPSFVLPDRAYERLRYGMNGYDRTSLSLELLAARHMATHRNCLYHILYGDNCYLYLGHLNGWRGHRIIASFHHPPVKFAERIQRPEQLKRLSAAIILGSNQRASFADILPYERVHLVPYAVDTSFFTPPKEFCEREESVCLFVGAHLRDFSTLRLLIEDAQILAPHLTFFIVHHPKYIGEFSGLEGNYRLFSNIPEQELLSLYQRATLLIQPLRDTVANTALLESMSCGIPIVVTDVGAARDYVDESFGYFVPPFNPDAMLEAILHLIDDPERRKQMSVNARKKALEFDWRVVARQMEEVYVQVFSDP